MSRRNNLMQAYTNSPWRKQWQFIGLFLLVLVVIVIMAGIYLDVTARAATIGREIQSMQTEIEHSKHQIADYETQLANITSAREMRRRAEDMGFHPIDPNTALYIEVPGYSGRQTAQLGISSRLETGTGILSPEYKKSLFDWFKEILTQPTGIFDGVLR